MAKDYVYCENGVGFPSLLHLTVPYNFGFPGAIGVFFSMLPVSLMIVYFLAFVLTRKFTFAIICALGGLASAVNQFVLKPINEQPRPAEGCLKDNDGFPSGHSVNALGVWAFLTLQLLFDRYRYTWRQRIILICIFLVIFGLNGPARHIVKDHTWLQVGVGMGAGVIWGSIVWLITRFIFQRYLLEKLMCTKFARVVRLVNDLDPDFRHSKYEGKRFAEQENKHKESSKHDTYETPKEQENSKRCHKAIAVHLISAFVQIVLGVIAISYPIFVSDMPTTCKRADVSLLISIGCFTVSIGLAQIFVAYLLYRKSKEQKWYPFLIKCAVIFFSALFIQSALYCFLAGSAVNKQQCPYKGRISRTLAYVIAWGVIELVMLIYWIAALFILKLNRLYADQLVTYPVSGSRMPTAI